jgi:uncharacterized protein (DUF1810 family)
MLEGLKRLFGGGPVAAKGWDALAPWAASRQYVFRGVRENDGFVIDGRLGAVPWRLEWGPSQRPYVPGNELRLRAQLGVQHDLQIVLLNRLLQEQMEKAVFDQYVEGVQTRIDHQTPPEMRWLVMFPKLAGSEMGPLKERFVAISSIKPWLVQWLNGPLSVALLGKAMDAATPFVLMIGRGRLTLRTAQGEPDARELDAWLRLFETAMREARRVATQAAESTGMPSTQPSMWSPSSRLPPEEPRK